MFKTILNSMRGWNKNETKGAERETAAVSMMESMESRTLMSVTATTGTFTLTFNGQTTTPDADTAPAETLSAGSNTKGILIGLLLPAIQKVR